MPGMGGLEHNEIVNYLSTTYGVSADRRYTIDGLQPFAGKNKFEGDYVGNSAKCDAWVDVVINEGWNATLGKFIVLANQAIKDGKYVWIVVDTETMFNKHKNDNKYHRMMKPEFIKVQLDWYRFLIRLVQKVFLPEATSKIKLFNYDRCKDDKLVPILE